MCYSHAIRHANFGACYEYERGFIWAMQADTKLALRRGNLSIAADTALSVAGHPPDTYLSVHGGWSKVP